MKDSVRDSAVSVQQNQQQELRCCCGRLVARWIRGNTLELKCRRCRRLLRVRLVCEGEPAKGRDPPESVEREENAYVCCLCVKRPEVEHPEPQG